MGRSPCCDKAKVKRGPWSPEEDAALIDYLRKHGSAGNWIALPLKAGLKRCGKSCRLRWLNYLRPDIKHGAFTAEEDDIICTLYSKMGSRWSIIASQLAGRTDNDVKNHWNSKLKKKLLATKLDNNNNNSSSSNATADLMLPLLPQMEALNPTFPPPMTFPKMPFLADHYFPSGQIVDSKTTLMAYDPIIHFPLPKFPESAKSSNHLCNFSSSQEGSTVSGSSSMAMEDNYTAWSRTGGLELEELAVDRIGYGYSYDLMGGIWSQEAVFGDFPSISYENLANTCYVDTKPQGMHVP